MSAAEALDSPADGGAAAAAPLGVPVRAGRLHVARVRQWLPSDGPVAVVAGFASACWLGSPETKAPDLGRLAYRSLTAVDSRGRVVLDRQVRAWLAVADTASFEVAVMPLQPTGVLVVPVEDFARRFEAVTR